MKRIIPPKLGHWIGWGVVLLVLGSCTARVPPSQRLPVIPPGVDVFKPTFFVDESGRTCGQNVCFRDQFGKAKPTLVLQTLKYNAQMSDAIVFDFGESAEDYCFRLVFFQDERSYLNHPAVVKSGRPYNAQKEPWLLTDCPRGQRCSSQNQSPFARGDSRLYVRNMSDKAWFVPPPPDDKGSDIDVWYRIEAVKGEQNKRCPVGASPTVISGDPRIKFKHVGF